MVIVNDLKPGMTYLFEGELFQCLELSLNKTAMRKMVVKAHSKNLRTGTIKDNVFTGGDKVETVQIDKREMTYLYNDGTNLVFMDTETYEQMEIPADHLTWESQFLKENDNISVTSFEGELLGVILPDKVQLKITECEQAVKGNTATAATKNAVLETGLAIKVPLFIQEGEMVEIRTSDGTYCGRA